MVSCCGEVKEVASCDPCSPPEVDCAVKVEEKEREIWGRFNNMIENCLEYAEKAGREGRPLVGIMCEYTPRELIMAAGAVPVCLCGGSLDTIAAAEEDLPSNLCPLIKSTYGYHKEKSNPFLENAALIVGETTCDGKKKMYEILAKERPVYVLELPQKQDDSHAMVHWMREVEKFRTHLEETFNTHITEEKLKDAVSVMNRERGLRLALAQLMKKNDPPLTGSELLELKSIISGIPCDLGEYERLIRELPKRRFETKGRTRVLLTGVPTVHGAERVVNMIEELGGLVVCMENCAGVKPLLENVAEDGDDILRSIAEHYYHLPCSVMTPNKKRFDWIRQLTEEYKPDCVIELVWQACLTYDVESYHVKKLVEDELNMPYLRIVTDYSPADSARLAVRIEALFETVKRRVADKA